MRIPESMSSTSDWDVLGEPIAALEGLGSVFKCATITEPVPDDFLKGLGSVLTILAQAIQMEANIIDVAFLESTRMERKAPDEMWARLRELSELEELLQQAQTG